MDSALKEFKQCLKDYPPAEMWTMTKTLWDIYVVEALHRRPDLAEHGSSFKQDIAMSSAFQTCHPTSGSKMKPSAAVKKSANATRGASVSGSGGATKDKARE